jgi:hypothetical protein
MVQARGRMLQSMKSLGTITTMTYNSETLRLRVAFDTRRVIVFYRVPAAIQSVLVRDEKPDAFLASHVMGRFAWTEVGVPSFP